jgi:histidine phosphotransferase ChpT
MPNDDPDLAALIGSRICHDLISPIGAINNGLELLGMAGSTSGPELSLISESVGNASARIRFFRLAFGAASAQEISRREILSVLDDITRGSKLRVVWDCDGGAQRADVRLIFLAEQCLESAMPYGGEITISDGPGGWTIRGRSEKFKIDSDLWAMLTDGKAHSDITPAQVHFALLAVHSKDEGRALRSMISQDEITIQI